MGTRHTYQTALMRACVLVGDETALAKRLHVPVAAVVGWLLGDEPLPTEIFLRVVDILVEANDQKIEANAQQVEDNRALLDQIRARHLLARIRKKHRYSPPVTK